MHHKSNKVVNVGIKGFRTISSSKTVPIAGADQYCHLCLICDKFMWTILVLFLKGVVKIFEMLWFPMVLKILCATANSDSCYFSKLVLDDHRLIMCLFFI